MKLIIAILICLTCPALVGAQGLSIMVHEMTVDIPRGDSTRIAVLEFSYADNKVSQGPAIVQERITTALVKKRVGIVVERKLLDQVMGELKLQRSGIMDEGTIKQIGKVLGVEYVVTGTLNDISDKRTEVNARIVNVETAKVLAASSTEIPKTWGNDGMDRLSEETARAVDTELADRDPSLKQTKSIAATKEYMDMKLQELKRGDITSNGDGIVIQGSTVTVEDFGKAVMQTMANGLKDKGLEVPVSIGGK